MGGGLHNYLAHGVDLLYIVIWRYNHNLEFDKRVTSIGQLTDDVCA